MTLEERAAAEAADLHRFLQAWMRGEIAPTAENFARFEAAMAPDMTMVSPAGLLSGRAAVVEMVRGLHGARSPGFRIEVRAAAARPAGAGAALATYEEWQEEAGARTGRVASALMRARADAPAGVEWALVHETWLPGAAPAGQVEVFSRA